MSLRKFINHTPNDFVKVTGLNIREPFASLIAVGRKTIETRRYKPADEVIGQRIAIVATGVGSAKIIGSVIVDSFFAFTSYSHWESEIESHMVDKCNCRYAFNNSESFYGWNLSDAKWYQVHRDAPAVTGRIYRKECLIKPEDF